MELNSPSNNNVVDQQLSADQNDKQKSVLRIKLFLIAAVVATLIAISSVFIAIKSTTKNILPATPTETPKPTLPPFPSEEGYVKNQLIVEYKAGMSPAELIDNNERSKLASSLQELGIISQDKLYNSDDPKLRNFYVLTFKDGVDVKDITDKIYAIPEIKGVEPNVIYEILK